MGEQNVNSDLDRERRKNFMRNLFNDIKALEIMVEKDMIESGITRIGAEQELCLIDKHFRPAPRSMEILEKVNNPKLTHELSRFNMEINLDPRVFSGTALSDMENELLNCLRGLRKTLTKEELDYILVGILPTIRQNDMTLDMLTPMPRYFALNKTMMDLRGSDYEFRIEGMDELICKHDSFMFESCNTSFQIHYQTSSDEFISKYNWAQAISGPVMSVCTNSPFLFSKRLWRETRIALFQQSVDTRGSHQLKREEFPRVFFGDKWLENHVTDIFKEDVARYRVVINSEIDVDSVKVLEEGGIPDLRALRLHNGTIYKWNRACYGISEGKPHLRIENRYIPSGPSVIDEVANAAYWLGLMHGMPKKFSNLPKLQDFEQSKVNFLKACRMGMGTLFRWVDDKVYSAYDLTMKELLPIAESGLRDAGVDPEDIDRYLRVIEGRVSKGRSGSQWMIDSVMGMKDKGTREESMIALTAGIVKRQKRNRPVYTWSNAKIDEAGSWVNRYWRIDQIMTRNLYIVQEDDMIDLVPNIMDWKNIRHVLVEDSNNVLVGLLTSGTLVHYYSSKMNDEGDVLVRDVMIKDVITIGPETLTKDAIGLMRKHKIGCLPVVSEEKHLLGIVTEHDFVNVADHFLQEFMG
jgi:CBS domain-containing protein